MKRRQERRRKKLLDDLKDRRGCCELKEEALDRTVWRNRFARGFGLVVWQITDDDDTSLNMRLYKNAKNCGYSFPLFWPKQIIDIFNHIDHGSAVRSLFPLWTWLHRSHAHCPQTSSSCAALHAGCTNSLMTQPTAELCAPNLCYN